MIIFNSVEEHMATYFYNRAKGELEEERILGDSLLKLAYQSPIRGLLKWPLFCCSLFSRLMGAYCDSRLSRRKIEGTIASLGIDMSQFQVPQGGYSSFNEFFARHLLPGARPFATAGLCSPADSRVTVYPELTDGLCVPVKGAAFTLSELVEDMALAKQFEGGSLAVFRLCPADYHRFHFPDSGRVVRSWRIGGRYNSVHPIALQQKIKVFTTNVRELTLMQLEHFGHALYIEVGAFGVGTIVQSYPQPTFDRGDEKGYFTFGGSTVILVLKAGAVQYDADILQHSRDGIETLVRAGEPIAHG